MESEAVLLLLIGSGLLFIALGVPIAFSLGFTATAAALLIWPPARLALLASSGYSSFQDLNLAAIPMFVFMGWILQKSGIAEDMFASVEILVRRVSGGLAVGTILISALLGAVMGELAAALVPVSSIALPALLKRGFNVHLTVGLIMAGSLLGLIIPPSIEIIVYSSATGTSLGRMYLAAFLPGLLLAGSYIAYIVLRCRLNPAMAPTPKDLPERKDRRSHVWGLVQPVGLMLLLIVGIYAGVFSPMEASTVGAALSLLIAAFNRRLTFATFKDALGMTVRVSTMILWLFIAIGIFMVVFNSLGGLREAKELAQSLPGSGWAALVASQLLLLVGGAFIDEFVLILLFGPVFSGTMIDFGFDPYWYGILFIMNMQVAFLSPPYGFALFCMRASIPPEYNVTMIDIYRSAIPFIGLQVFCLVLVMGIPEIATFLPGLLVR